VNPAASRLAALTKELYEQWQRTKESWSDAKCQEFERQYMLELFSSVDKTVAVIEQLDKILARIKHDCA
jgi:hypothetical protein